MSEKSADVVPIDLSAWVTAAQANPVLLLQRQATEVILTAIGLSATLSDSLVLKGGALMALAFKSDRATGDVDFTAQTTPEDLVEQVRDELNGCIPESLRKLGHLDLLCRVQTIKKKPRPQNFENLEFPALDISIGYARKGSPQEKGFLKGQASTILSLEISFKDQVYEFQELHLFDPHVCVKAFSINEIFAEKCRALLQQKAEYRDRYRRQDVFDLWHLLTHQREDIDKKLTLEILKAKCDKRGIDLNKTSLNDKEVYDRAAADWKTIALEINELPNFDTCYRIVREFFEELPW